MTNKYLVRITDNKNVHHYIGTKSIVTEPITNEQLHEFTMKYGFDSESDAIESEQSFMLNDTAAYGSVVCIKVDNTAVLEKSPTVAQIDFEFRGKDYIMYYLCDKMTVDDACKEIDLIDMGGGNPEFAPYFLIVGENKAPILSAIRDRIIETATTEVNSIWRYKEEV